MSVFKFAGDRSISIRIDFEATLLRAWLLNVALILWVGWHYDVWSVFQGRLVFPTYIGALVALNAGLEWSGSSAIQSNMALYSLAALLLLFLAHFASEFWLTAAYPTNPLSMDHMPYKIDMNSR